MKKFAMAIAWMLIVSVIAFIIDSLRRIIHNWHSRHTAIRVVTRVFNDEKTSGEFDKNAKIAIKMFNEMNSK